MPLDSVYLRQIVSLLQGTPGGIPPYPTVTDNVALRMIVALLTAAQSGGGGGGSATPIPNNTLAGNTSGAAATPTGLTPSQVKTLLAVAATDVTGLSALATNPSGAGLTGGTVALSKLANVSGDTFLGGIHGSGGNPPSALSATQAKAILQYTASDVSAMPGRSISWTPTTADWYRLVNETVASGQGGAYIVLSGPGAAGAAPWMTILAFQANSQNLGNFGNGVNLLLSTQGSPIDLARVNNNTTTTTNFAFDVHFNTASPGTVNASIFQAPSGNPITTPVVGTDLGNGQYLTVLPGGIRSTGLAVFGSLISGEFFQVGAAAGQIFCNNPTNVPAGPNGNYNGNPGDVFLFNNGASGKTLWVKDNGTGNTGWVPLSAYMPTPPTTSASTGVPGNFAADNNFFYYYGASAWRRVTGSSF